MRWACSAPRPPILGAEVVFELPDKAPLVLADEARLEQVLVNLLRNALDAVSARNHRLITISLGEDEEHVLLSVRDTGPGIDEEDLPRLFDPFFTTKEVGEGLGLGLSISYGIVQGFGGRIWAANHPDGGAVFTVALRRAPEAGKGAVFTIRAAIVAAMRFLLASPLFHAGLRANSAELPHGSGPRWRPRRRP